MIDWENLVVYWLLVGTGLVCTMNFFHGRAGSHSSNAQDLAALLMGPVGLLAALCQVIGSMTRKNRKGLDYYQRGGK